MENVDLEDQVVMGGEQTTEDRFDALLKLIEEKKYDKMSYEPGNKIEIESELFLDFINFTAHAHKNLQRISENYMQLMEVINGYSVFTGEMLDVSSRMQFKLMEKHVQNCEAGLTLDKSKLDKLDAIKKVNVKPEKK